MYAVNCKRMDHRLRPGSVEGKTEQTTDRQTLVVRTATGVVWKGRQWNAWTETALALGPVRS